MSSDDGVSRRELLSAGVSAATTPVILQSDESSWLEDLLSWGDDEDVNAPLAAGMADERSEVDPSLAAAYFALDTGAVYEPTDDYSEWSKIKTTGESPAYTSISHKDSGQQVVNESGDVTAPVNNDSVSTKNASIKKQFHIDYSQNNPLPERSFEQSGPPNLKPHPGASNPVLTVSDVSDLSDADFVADPFLVHENGMYYLFFETARANNPNAISYASSPDGLTWTYESSVITDASVEYSYAQIFKYGGRWYMMPSTGADTNEVHIYQADSFPGSWSKTETPLTGNAHLDPTIFQHNGHWWLISADNSTSPYSINAYYADQPIGGSWTAHSQNPILQQKRTQRPGGRPLTYPDSVDFFWQDWVNQGSDMLRCYRITELTSSSFAHSEISTSPLLQPARNGKWNDRNMHHLDILTGYVGGPPLAVVDGKNSNEEWSLGIYTVADTPETDFRVSRTGTNQSILSDTFTTINFDTTEYDIADAVSLSNDQFTAPTSGYYEFTGLATFDVTGSPCRVLARLRNVTAGEVLGENNSAMSSDIRETTQVTATGYLTEGDAVELLVWQNSGGSMDLISSSRSLYIEGKKTR